MTPAAPIPPRLRAGYADCAIGQLHYLHWQPEAAQGAPLVLLHPRSRSLRRLLPGLPPGLAAYIVDLPGLGNSAPLPPGATMADAAHALAQCLDALGVGAAHVYGIHTGNKVAAALAAGWPARVRSLMLCGKSHSIVPDQALRNAAMKAQGDQPDSLVVRFEGRYLDDTDAAQGMPRLYEANFNFDLAAAVAACRAPLRVIEITSPAEDRDHGRQGAALAALATASPGAHHTELPQVDSTGLDMYTGAAAMAAAMADFILGLPAPLQETSPL